MGILISKCNVCGKIFEHSPTNSPLACPDCAGNTEKTLNRIYTKDTVNLVCKWHSEGMSVKDIGALLNRSPANIEAALQIGGAL